MCQEAVQAALNDLSPTLQIIRDTRHATPKSIAEIAAKVPSLLSPRGTSHVDQGAGTTVVDKGEKSNGFRVQGWGDGWGDSSPTITPTSSRGGGRVGRSEAMAASRPLSASAAKRSTPGRDSYVDGNAGWGNSGGRIEGDKDISRRGHRLTSDGRAPPDYLARTALQDTTPIVGGAAATVRKGFGDMKAGLAMARSDNRQDQSLAENIEDSHSKDDAMRRRLLQLQQRVRNNQD